MKLAFLTLMSIVALDSHGAPAQFEAVTVIMLTTSISDEVSAHELQLNVTRRADIGVHIAYYVAQRNKDMVPSIRLDAGDATFIVELFPLKQEVYLNRPTQEEVDVLAEMFGTKPTWLEIAQFSDL